LAVYVLVGVAGGLFATAYVQMMHLLRYRLGAVHLPPAVGPLAAGLMVGVVALAWPDVLGTGYRAMDGALHNQYAWSTMATLAVVKCLVSGVAFGTGTPGGLFAPTLFLGVMLGGAVGGVAPEWIQPAARSAIVLAGMAAMFAGVFRAPMTAVFMAFELSGTAGSIVPAMIAATLAFLVARRLQRQSILDLVAEHEGANLPSTRLARPDAPLHVEDAMAAIPDSVILLDASLSAAAAGAILETSAAELGLLEGAGGRWLVADLRVLRTMAADPSAWNDLRHLPDPTRPSSPADVQAVHPAYPDEWLDVALRELTKAPVVPVVSRLDAHRVIGVVRVEDVRRAYGAA
jgi:CIC family chloride channel protein